MHRRDRDAAWPAVAAQLRDTVGVADRATLLATAALALSQVNRVIGAVRGAEAEPPTSLNATLEFDVHAGSIVVRQWPKHPLVCLESKLLVLPKLSSQFDETFARESTARFVVRMVAPDPQFHPVARISQNQFAVRFPVALRLRIGRFHLHVHARRHHAPAGVGYRPANFCQCQ